MFWLSFWDILISSFLIYIHACTQQSYYHICFCIWSDYVLIIFEKIILIPSQVRNWLEEETLSLDFSIGKNSSEGKTHMMCIEGTEGT